MSSQPTFKKNIGIRLKEVYAHHEYVIDQSTFEKTILQLMEVLKPEHVDDFFIDVCHGRFGVLYKMPTSILSMAYKFKVEKVNEPNYKILERR